MSGTRSTPNAFTLIEILVMLGILTILVGLALPMFQQTRAKSKLARVQADISQIESALNLYKMDYGAGPDASITALIANDPGGYTILSPANPLISTSTGEPYFIVPSARCDAATHQFLDPWKTPYYIVPIATHNTNSFDIFSAGPDKIRQNLPNSDDINNWDR